LSKLQQLWVEKYRPTTLDTYIFQNPKQQTVLEKMVETGSIPHLLFYGGAGSGKTTLAKVLINELGIDTSFDFLQVNASDDNSVDFVRDTIKSFAMTSSIGTFKVILLDEADYMSQNAQAMLRNLMETYADNVRFILTCNYEHKIIPAIKSRAQSFEFKTPDSDDISVFLINMLMEEGISLKKKDLATLDLYISANPSDIRKIINNVELGCASGKLVSPSSDSSSGDNYRAEFLENALDGEWFAARQVLMKNAVISDLDDIFTLLYDNVDKFTMLKEQSDRDKAIVLISQYMCRIPSASNPLIVLDALLISIGMIGG
jgi:replication factor C small subunit